MIKGLMNLIKNAGRAADAKAQKGADAIERENSVEFGKQDVAQMKADLGSINNNIGTIKGEIAVLKDKVKGIKDQIKKHESDAAELDAAGNEKLAIKHCEAAEALESQLEPLEMALKQQTSLLEDQMKAKEEMKRNVQQAEADLMTLKAMEDAATANEKLATINTSSSSSALASFRQRKEDAKKRLVKAQALKEESSAEDSLDSETAAALGHSGGKSRLEKLRAAKCAVKA